MVSSGIIANSDYVKANADLVRRFMVGGQESTRSTLHLAELFRLADKAGLLANPELATQRMKPVLATHGIES